MTYKHQIPSLFAPRLYQKEPLDWLYPWSPDAHTTPLAPIQGLYTKNRESGCHEGAMTLPEGS